MNGEKTAFIIPVMNVSSLLPRFLNELSLNQSQNKVFIFIDNGSRDGTVEVLRSFLNKSILRAYIFENGRNAGYGFSVKRGVKYAFEELGVDLAVVMHADLQVEFSDIINHITKSRGERKTSFVYLQRKFVWGNHLEAVNSNRVVGNKALAYLARVMLATRIDDINSPFLLISNEIFRNYFRHDLLTSGIFLHPQLNLLVFSTFPNRVVVREVIWKRAPETVRRPLLGMGIVLCITIIHLALWVRFFGRNPSASLKAMNKILLLAEKRKFL